MNKSFKYIACFLLLSTALASCMEEREITYTGPTTVELKNHLLTRNANYIETATPGVYPNATATPITFNSKYISVNNRAVDSVLVQLVGPQSSTDITVEYTLGTMEIPANQAATLFPAVEGTHFEFATPGARTVTIPANSSFGWILIRPIPGSAPAGNRYFLVLDLLGNDQVPASVNYSTFTNYLRD